MRPIPTPVHPVIQIHPMPRAESSDETEQHTQYSDSFSYPRIAGSLSARSVKALMEGEFFFLYIHWRIFCSIIDNGESPRLSALRLRGPRGARVCSLNEYSIITGQARTEATRKCRAIVEKKKLIGGGVVRCGAVLVSWAQTSRREQEIQGYPRK